MKLATILLLVFAALLGGCVHAVGGYQTRVHVVRAGETLYQIAWEHGLDQRDLARWNGLADPDRLAVGQRLRLSPPAVAAVAPPAARPAPPRSTEPPRSTAPRRSAVPAPAAPPSPPLAALPPPVWMWPTDGRVATRFGGGEGIATGIGIDGREGQAVYAAAAGRVVYAGNGLIGYGQLLIIKHNDTYLSAYGYNSRLIVTQGQDVQRGQTIALMGFGPERRARLHFEIRRNGVPVDPLLFLARR